MRLCFKQKQGSERNSRTERTQSDVFALPAVQMRKPEARRITEGVPCLMSERLWVLCGEMCRNGNGRVWKCHRAGICLCVTVTKFMLSSSSLSPSHSLGGFSSCRGTLYLTRGGRKGISSTGTLPPRNSYLSCGMLNAALALHRISLRRVKKKKATGSVEGKIEFTR